MNMLLIALIIIMLWRISVAVNKGIVREALSFVSVIFAVLVVGAVSLIVNAYHTKEFLTIALMVVIIVVLSIIYSIIKIVVFPAKILTKLPVISSADKVCGFVMGVAETLLLFWGLCYAVMYIELGTLSEQILIMIGESKILTMLYQYNLLGVLFELIKEKISTGI
jgi:uncharacterized membrane protein required for colicin V production